MGGTETESMRLLFVLLCVAAVTRADPARLRLTRGAGDNLYSQQRANDSCLCAPFYNCDDGQVITDGAGLLDIRFGPRNKCEGFSICCDDDEKIKKIEAKPGIDKGVMTTIKDGISDLFNGGSQTRPAGAADCVCVAFFLCDGGVLAPEIASQVDTRQVSRTGRCNHDNEQCCTLPKATPGGGGSSGSGGVVAPTTPCTCTGRQYCSQADIQPLRLGQATCRADEVCCSKPQSGGGSGTSGQGGAVTVPDSQRPDYDVWKFCKSYPLSVACVRSRQINARPTLRDAPGFDSDADARRIYSAFGFAYLTADDDVLIEILTQRTFEQRNLIAQAYGKIFNREFDDDIDRATHGNYGSLMEALVESSSYYNFLAQSLRDSMHGLGTDEDTVLETLISSTNDEIDIIKRHYYELDGNPNLIADIQGDFSGDLEDILVALVNGSRDNSFRVSKERAREQAAALYQAGKGRLGTEEETFKYYLTHENYPQLALIFSEYEQLAGESFSEALKDEFSRRVEDATLAIVDVTRNLPLYFAKRLHHAIWGRGPIGKDDSSLIRIIVARAEIDLATIAQEYYNKYGKKLVDHITLRSLGDYDEALASLVNGNIPTY